MKNMLRLFSVGGLVTVLCSSQAFSQAWSVQATNKLPARAPTTIAPVPPRATQPVPARTQVVNRASPMFSSTPLPDGILAFDALEKEFIAKHGEQNCPFDFSVTNISPADVTITFIQTSCGCTTARTQLPLKLAAGQTVDIPINMNVVGKSGVVAKTITIHTDKGQKQLLVKSNIQPPPADPAAMAMNRERNQQIATADRQAVFKGDCAKCHVEPTVGKYGKDLYVAACGICHEAEHRATMVADLHQLKVTPTAEYWKFYVVNGKPATLMPAFAAAQGGPLSDAQIDSLVSYLLHDFPNSKTNAAAHASVR